MCAVAARNSGPRSVAPQSRSADNPTSVLSEGETAEQQRQGPPALAGSEGNRTAGPICHDVSGPCFAGIADGKGGRCAGRAARGGGAGAGGHVTGGVRRDPRRTGAVAAADHGGAATRRAGRERDRAGPAHSVGGWRSRVVRIDGEVVLRAAPLRRPGGEACAAVRTGQGWRYPSRWSIWRTSSWARDLMVSRPARPQGRGTVSTAQTVPSAMPVRSMSGAPR